MPQNTNLSKEWQEELGHNWEDIHKNLLHTIGNLTLTGSNAKLGDKTFIEKKTMPNGYNDSTINLNKYFKDIEHWTGEEITKRSEYLLEQAKEIWKYPELSHETIQKYENNTKETNLDSYKPKQNKNDNYRYWSDCKRIIDKNYDFKSTKPRSSNRYILRIGTNKANIRLIINFNNNEVKTQLYFPKDKELFAHLYNQKEEIESELNMELNWNSPNDKYYSSVSVVKTFNLEDDWNWEDAINWQLTIAEKLRNSFYDRIKQFN